MTQTPNYNLLKPGYDDPVDVANLNDNADIIDSTLAAKANLVGGKVPASELPSYVDDVVEGYYYNGAFYSDAGHSVPITAERGKIYVDLDTENCYRWTGTFFVQISSPESPIVEGYYYNGAFYEDAAHLTPITGETGKLYIDLPTNDVYRYSGAAYVKLSTPESEIYWATYDTTLDAAGIAAAYAELQAAVSAGKLIVMFISPYTYYCSDFIGGVQPAFYFCNYDQFPILRKYTFSSITGWSAMSQATIATKTYVDTAIADAGNLPQGTNQDDILVWDSVLQEWTTASYPSGSLPTGTTDDDILVWDDSNQEWDTRAKGSISNGNTGWVTGGDIYTVVGDVESALIALIGGES